MISIAILDDHKMVIKGLESMLENSPTVKIVGTYTTGEDMLKRLEVDNPHILLLDINLPDHSGIELCNRVSKKNATIGIIALSNYDDTSFIKNMIRNGAKSYLLKNTEKQELITAIETVFRGEQYLPQKIKNALLNESFGLATSSYFIPKLSRREKEILNLISNELTTNEIAEKLFISNKTVESHRKNLLQKLNARNTAGLIKTAINKGLIGL